MRKTDILKRIKEIGLLPVLRASSAGEALALAEAIAEGGISAIEVTMTVPGAVEVIETLIRQTGDRILIGAGTVLDPETARACMLAGAAFIVSPSLNLRTIEICHRYSVPVIPGALTPTEVVTAWEAGADIVKVFPADVVGPAFFKAIKGPLPQIRVMPTGGVDLTTAAAFLKAGACCLGVGSQLVDPALVAARNFTRIRELAQQYVAIVKETRTTMKK